jgi:hypothetical protein
MRRQIVGSIVLFKRRGREEMGVAYKVPMKFCGMPEMGDPSLELFLR